METKTRRRQKGMRREFGRSCALVAVVELLACSSAVMRPPQGRSPLLLLLSSACLLRELLQTRSSL